jgi:hypothetical protein
MPTEKVIHPPTQAQSFEEIFYPQEASASGLLLRLLYNKTSEDEIPTTQAVDRNQDLTRRMGKLFTLSAHPG